MKMKYTYQRNINLIKLLYESDFAKILCNGNLTKSFVRLRPVIDSFYKDPDVFDMKKICDKKILQSDIHLGLDGLCGWKMLFDIYDGDPKWLEDYETIRGSKLGYILLPNSMDKRKHKTINQLKYSVFGDRIDYTLYDISLFFDEKKRSECMLSEAYQGETEKFLIKCGNIKKFIDDANKTLNVFLNEKNEVLNIITKKPLELKELKDCKFSPRWGVRNKKEYWEKYIKEILKLCKKAEKLEN